MSEEPGLRVFFQTPPPGRRVGGLDTALSGWRQALEQDGVEVVENAPARHWPSSRNGREVVHFHGLWEPGHRPLTFHCRRHGIPYVISPHGMLEPWAFRHKWWKKWPYFQLFEKARLQRASAVLTTGRQEAENCHRQVPRASIVALPLGVADAPSWRAKHREEARRGFGLAEDRLVLLFLSRIDPKKGLRYLLEGLAHPSMAGWRGRAELWVVGGGDSAYVESMKGLARKLGSQLPPVKWMGPVWGVDRWKFLQAADLFFLPTHSENFGLAILEALLCGVPVMTTRYTPWSDEKAPGALSFCEPSGESLARAMVEWEDRLPLGEEHREAIAGWADTRFSWAHLGPRYREFYERYV